MRRFVPQLLKWAQEGKDPELRADVVLEELPDAYLRPIHEQLARGDAFVAEFLEAFPEAQDVREWFGLFFARLFEELERMWQPPDGDDDGAQEGELEDELEEEVEAPSSSSSAAADVAPEPDA